MTETAASRPRPAGQAHDWSRNPPIGLAGIAYFTPVYEYAALADRKASFFLSASGMMLTVLGFFVARIAHLLAPHDWRAWLFGSVLAAVVTLIVVAAVVAYFSFSRLLPPTPPSLIIFRDVARRSLADYERDVAALSHADAFIDSLRYNHVVARWAVYKFRMVDRSLRLLRVAIPLWMLVLLVLALAG